MSFTKDPTRLPVADIDQSGLSQQIYVQLKNAILNGTFALSERLSTEQLAKHFKVSAMPVRDALKALEADGLVQILPRRGVFVTEVKSNTVKEIFHIRRIIECGAIDNLAEMESSIVDQLQDKFAQMESLRQGQVYSQYAQYVELDAQFHHQIVAIAANQQLSQLYEGLRWPIQLVLVLSHSESQRAQQTSREHAAVIDAIVAKDGIRAKEAITLHLINAEQDLLRRIPS